MRYEATGLRAQERRYIANTHVWMVVLVLISISAGVSLLFVNPMIIFGLIGIIVMAVLLLRNPYLGVLAYLLFEYANLSAMYPALQKLQFGKLIVIPTIVIWLVRKIATHNPRIPVDRVYWVFAAWLGLALASASMAMDPGRAFQASFDLFKWFLVTFLIVSLVDTMPKWNLAMWLVLLLNFKLSQFQIRSFAAGFASAHNKAFFIADGVGAGSTKFFANATDFGLGMVVVMPLAFYMIMSVKSKILKIAAIVMSSAFAISILKSGSRGAALALFVLVAIYWFKSKKKLVPLILGIAFVGLFWISAPDAWRSRFEASKDYEEGTAKQRIELWQAGMDMFAKHPILGVGINNFAVVFDARYRTSRYVGASAPHSIYIQALTELGLAGLVVVVATMLLLLRRNWQTRKLCEESGLEDQSIVNFSHALDLSIIGYAIGGAFLTVLYYPHLYIMAGFALALNHIARRKALSSPEPAGVDV